MPDRFRSDRFLPDRDLHFLVISKIAQTDFAQNDYLFGQAGVIVVNDPWVSHSGVDSGGQKSSTFPSLQKSSKPILLRSISFFFGQVKVIVIDGIRGYLTADR